jgi:hypothetical protein
VDLSLFKTFDITEQLKVEFRTEAFNVFNTTQFANPNSSMSLTPYTATAPCSGSYPVAGFQPVSPLESARPRRTPTTRVSSSSRQG